MQCDAVCIIYGMIQPPDHFESISAFKAADVLQCVAVCCSVLVCVALCFVEVQCGAACCSVVQYVSYTACSSHHMILSPSLPLTLQVCCSVLQCVAVCCSVLQCVAVCCSSAHTFKRDLHSYSRCGCCDAGRIIHHHVLCVCVCVCVYVCVCVCVCVVCGVCSVVGGGCGMWYMVCGKVAFVE